MQLIAMLEPLLYLGLFLMVTGTYAVVARLILPSHQPYREYKIRFAMLLPSLFLVYALLVGISFSVLGFDQWEIFPVDLSRRLPNGYELEVSRELPGYGSIQRSTATGRNVINGWVGRFAVEGPFIFGQYNWRFDATPSTLARNGGYGYFALDTQHDTNVDFAELSELNRYAGHAVYLEDTPSLGRYKSIYDVERLMLVCPPLVFTTLYFLFLSKVALRSRKMSQQISPHSQIPPQL